MLWDFRWIVFVELTENLCLWAVLLSTSATKRTRLSASRFGWLCEFLILILLWQCACVLARWHPLSSSADPLTFRPHVGVRQLWAPALSSTFLSLPHVLLFRPPSPLSSEVFCLNPPASLPHGPPASSHIAPTLAKFAYILQIRYSITLSVPFLHLCLICGCPATQDVNPFTPLSPASSPAWPTPFQLQVSLPSAPAGPFLCFPNPISWFCSHSSILCFLSIIWLLFIVLGLIIKWDSKWLICSFVDVLQVEFAFHLLDPLMHPFCASPRGQLDLHKGLCV